MINPDFKCDLRNYKLPLCGSLLHFEEKLSHARLGMWINEGKYN